MKKFISVAAAVLAVGLAGLSYYCSQHAMSSRLGIAGAIFNENPSAALPQTPQEIITQLTTESTTETTTETTTEATTQTTAAPTTKPTTLRVITTVAKTTLKALKDTGETKTKTEQYTEELKYGVTASVTEYKYYKIMEDGSSVYDRSTKEKVYDRTGYHATVDELKSEAYANMDEYASERKAVLKIVNAYRKNADAPALTVDDTLTRAANVRAVEIAWSDVHNHTRPDGSSWKTMFEAFDSANGIIGENIGWGYTTPEDVCRGWYNSYSHYVNIIKSDFKKTGIGVAAGPDGKLYWVELFSS